VEECEKEKGGRGCYDMHAAMSRPMVSVWVDVSSRPLVLGEEMRGVGRSTSSVFASVGVYENGEGVSSWVRQSEKQQRRRRQGMHDATTCRDKVVVVVRCANK
jgi:hypothetical protein